MKKHIYIIFFTFLCASIFLKTINQENNAQRVTINTEQIDKENTKINVAFHLKPNEAIHPNSINISVDTPTIQITNPINQIESSVKEFNKDFTISINAKKLENFNKENQNNLHVSYM